jgi:putative ABC transport system ATP-binding protein
VAPEPQPSPEPVLGFEGVRVTADDGAVLLEGVDAVVRPGSITVLAGPSGAGKSTLLRVLGVGMVFQKPVVFAGTVRENLRVADPDAEDGALARELERVGLVADLLDRTGDDLSGGEAQRMCIARALLTRPEVLLMDEPTSSLDPENRMGIEALARELADEGLGILWVTHDLVQAARLGDHVVVLVKGRNADADETARYLGSGERPDDT